MLVLLILVAVGLTYADEQLIMNTTGVVVTKTQKALLGKYICIDVIVNHCLGVYNELYDHGYF